SLTSSYPYTPTTSTPDDCETAAQWVHVKVPPLPFKPRSDDLLGTYDISMHIIPAASPRVTPNIPVSEPLPPSSERTEGDISNLGFELMEQQVRQGEDGYSGVTDERLLWNCVNRYVKKDRGVEVRTKGIILFLCARNGFSEGSENLIVYWIWETHLCYLLAACGVIDEMWSWESVQHGDSAPLNRQYFSGSCERSLLRPSA
ncbi:hypothetical protein DFJ58DRAFT_808376, partial [Suillus subalutaceus]|uniref:uncharacterized protein n=1 Tax=Suillus subalutaceus TaxID=48586 RepID=UPI001B866E0F